MFDSRKRRGGAGVPQRGIFVEGVWHCDCNPRLPANHFEVKKQGPNQGKWFRTCQKQQDGTNRCKFFLWDSDAHPREAAALANNTRTEPAHTAPKTPSERPASPPRPHTAGLVAGEFSRKRGRTTTADSDDEYGLGVNNATFNDELDHVSTRDEIPRKATRISEWTTPSTRRELPWNRNKPIGLSDIGLQTPQTCRTVQADLSSSKLGKPLFTPAHPPDVVQQTAMLSSSPYETPTPHRFKDVEQDDLIRDVLTLIQDTGARLTTTTKTNLSTLLLRHTKAAEGLRRGRDVTRTTIKARDAKIIELGYRISTLEAELEAEKAIVKHLRWQIQTGQPSSP